MSRIDPARPTLDSDEHEDEKTTIAPSPTGESAPSTETADAIREVILGPKLREDENRFRVIETELENLQQSFNALSQDVDTKLANKIDELTVDLHEELREFENKINEQINQVIGEVIADARKISIVADTLVQEVQEKIDKINNSNAVQIAELRDQMRRNCDTLRNELITETDSLDDNKISRLTLANNLIALGMKLKEGEGLNETELTE
ncbi:MAG: hypothetical protein OXP71_01975 [Candidatus Poribacteria bacterium]|nr:hypothetical protein [Candidatus Poribacteria bacterium]